MSRSRVALVAAGLAVLLLSAPGAAQAGPEPPVSPARPRLELASLDRAWIAPGESMRLLLRVENAPPGSEINVVAHDFPIARIRFDRTLTGENLPSTIGQVAFPVDALPAAPGGLRVLDLGVQDPAAPRDPARLLLEDTGVYPVELELKDAEGGVSDTFVLPVVVVVPDPDGTPAVGERLRVAWVWPLAAPPAILPDGTADPEVVAALRPGGRLARQVGAVTRVPDVPLTLAPAPETLEAWSGLAAEDPDLAVTVANAQVALRTNQVLAGPYVAIDVPSLVAGGLGGQVGAQRTRGRETLDALLGARVDTRTALPGPLDGAAFVQLTDAGVDRIIVRGEALAPREADSTPARPFTLQGGGRAATAVASDPGLDAILAGDAPPALRAQQLMATLAVIALELPNIPRGVVVVSPSDWPAPRALLEAVLIGLSNHPLVRPVDVDTLLAEVPPDVEEDDTPLARELAAITPEAPPVSAGAFLRAVSRLGAFRSLVGDDDPRLARGDRALTVAVTSAWEDAPVRARAELAVIDGAIADVLSRVRVPVGNTVTLTARRGSIPVTFRNETELTLRVRARLESRKLFFPDGAERDLELPPGNVTVGFTVESRTPGTFPLELTVTSVDGRLTIQETRVRVRSTFVSGVGLALTIGAAAFLALWWLLHTRRGRRARRERRRHSSAAPGPAR